MKINRENFPCTIRYVSSGFSYYSAIGKSFMTKSVAEMNTTMHH